MEPDYIEGGKNYCMHLGICTLRRSPEVCEFCYVVVPSINLLTSRSPHTGREHRELIGIRPFFIRIPTFGGLKQSTRFRFISDFLNQSGPLVLRRQMPILRASPPHRICRVTPLTIATALAIIRKYGSTVHRGSPGVKATVPGAVGGISFITDADGVKGI